MQINCVSSLSDDDEEALAPAIVALLAAFLDSVSVTYAIQARTTDGAVCRCARPPVPAGVRGASYQPWDSDAVPGDLDALNLSNQLPS
ncbi:MAG TPA: hypothetical protein VJN96_27105 [Vicinamibacterales bacterium]|nr:hypothetical protein [Vicinamibacterales bacterium]